jgi:hypothetical protein
VLPRAERSWRQRQRQRRRRECGRCRCQRSARGRNVRGTACVGGVPWTRRALARHVAAPALLPAAAAVSRRARCPQRRASAVLDLPDGLRGGGRADPLARVRTHISRRLPESLAGESCSLPVLHAGRAPGSLLKGRAKVDITILAWGPEPNVPCDVRATRVPTYVIRYRDSSARAHRPRTAHGHATAARDADGTITFHATAASSSVVLSFRYRTVYDTYSVRLSIGYSARRPTDLLAWGTRDAARIMYKPFPVRLFYCNGRFRLVRPTASRTGVESRTRRMV